MHLICRPNLVRCMRTDVKNNFTPIAACLTFGLLSPVFVSFLGRGGLATCVAVFGWLSFLAIAIIYPIFSIRNGVIWTRASTTYRADEPVRFWVGLIALEALMLLFLLLATFALYAYLNRSI